MVSEESKKVFIMGLKSFLEASEKLKWQFRGKATPKEIYCMELCNFLSYLAAADGELNPNERDFINELFGFNLTSKDIIEFVEEFDLYSRKFENKIPLSLEVCKTFDMKHSIINDGFGDTIIKVYYLIGLEFIMCDNSIKGNENTDLERYIAHMKSYKPVVYDANDDSILKFQSKKEDSIFASAGLANNELYVGSNKKGNVNSFSTAELLHHFFILTDIEGISGLISAFPNTPGDNALLVYCYLDYEAGTTFQVLAAGCYIDKILKLTLGDSLFAYKIRYESIEERGTLTALKEIPMKSHYEMVVESCKNYGDIELPIELDRLLDENSKTPGFPQDVLVYCIIHELRKMEGIWCRIIEKRSEGYIGFLLDEPYASEFGVHEGDKIVAVPIEQNDGEVLMISEF